MTTATNETIAAYEEQLEVHDDRGASTPRAHRKDPRRFFRRRRSAGLGIKGRNVSRSISGNFR